MKLVIRTVFFHFLCIIIFGLIYWNYSNEFIVKKNQQIELIDFLFVSTTIQAGVGLSDIAPGSDILKIIMILQQFIMISTNVFLLYIFTL